MFGETVKYIRTSKGVTQISVAQAAGISQGTYSKFEKNMIDLRGSTFMNILDFLDISQHEFLFIHNKGKLTQKERIIYLFFKHPYNDKKALTQIRLECESYLNTFNQDNIISDIQILCNALLLILENNDFKEAKLLVRPIWDRLSNHNELFLYDLYLMNAILYMFSLEEILEIKDFLKRAINKYLEFPNMKRLFINLYLNIALVGINSYEYQIAIDMIEPVIDIAKEIKAFIQLAIAYIRKGVCLNGLSLDGDFWINKGLNILEVLEEFKTLELMIREIETHSNAMK